MTSVRLTESAAHNKSFLSTGRPRRRSSPVATATDACLGADRIIVGRLVMARRIEERRLRPILPVEPPPERRPATGLAGRQFPEVGHDAMPRAAGRVYRKPCRIREALGRLRGESGQQFDPAVVDALVRWVGDAPSGREAASRHPRKTTAALRSSPDAISTRPSPTPASA